MVRSNVNLDRQTLMTHVAAFERHNGRVPNLRELANCLGLRSSELRSFIARCSLDEKTEGTSAFTASLREILVGNRASEDGFNPDWNQRKYREIVLLDLDGTKIGTMLSKSAQLIAQERQLHLFVLEPDANPPVALLMNFGESKYKQEKRSRAVAKAHSRPGLKKIRMRYSTGANDYKVKLANCKKFLKKGDEVKLEILLQGVEIDHADMALALLQQFADDMGELAVWSEDPKLDGTLASLLLMPAKQQKL